MSDREHDDSSPSDESPQAPTLVDVRDEVDGLIANGEFDRADERLEEAFETFGRVPQLRTLEAELRLEEDDLEDCLEIVDETLDEVDDPVTRAQLYEVKGYALYYLDRLDEARRAFNEAVQADGDSWAALIGRATVHDYLEFEHATLLDLNRAIDLDDQEAEPFVMRGMIRLGRGQLEEAELDLAYALECDPYEEEARLNYARLLALKGDSVDAREALERLVNQGEDPAFVVPGALLRSQLALGLGSAEAAASDAELAIELEPEEPWGYLALAAARITGGQGGEAIAALKEAEARMDHPSHFPDLYALRASAYEQVGKPDKAEGARKEAQGAARLPEFVYGEHLNPSHNVPVNPDKPIDVRNLMRQIFGDPNNAPEGYEEALREVIDQIPAYIEENPDAERLEIELPGIEDTDEPLGNLVVELNRQQNGRE